MSKAWSEVEKEEVCSLYNNLLAVDSREYVVLNMTHLACLSIPKTETESEGGTRLPAVLHVKRDDSPMGASPVARLQSKKSDDAQTPSQTPMCGLSDATTSNLHGDLADVEQSLEELASASDIGLIPRYVPNVHLSNVLCSVGQWKVWGAVGRVSDRPWNVCWTE